MASSKTQGKKGSQRKLTAILSADVVGYSRLMGNDEEATLETLTAYRKVFTSSIPKFWGRVVDAKGDALLAEFAAVTDAVTCAVDIQTEMAERNSKLTDDRRMDFRIGINLGEVMVKGDEIYGDGVNIAARLESLAEPGGICISRSAYDQVESKLNLECEYLGEQEVKNIARPVRAYKVLIKTGDAAHQVIKKRIKRVGRWRIRVVALAISAAVLLAGSGYLAWEYWPAASVIGNGGDSTWRDPLTGMEFVRVPGGSFEMGCHADAGKCFDDEMPVRTVRLDGFWMGKYEVTQEQWKRIMGNNPSEFKKSGSHPVENVSWNDVQKFIQILNAQSSAAFRLPSEAEWEYSCRDGGKSVKYGTRNGQISPNFANYNRGTNGTVSVGRYPPNGLGLHDMSGNVWEWVQDKYTGYGNVGGDNPLYEDENSDAERVDRGGGWENAPRSLRCANRDGYFWGFRGAPLGFRLVRNG